MAPHQVERLRGKKSPRRGLIGGLLLFGICVGIPTINGATVDVTLKPEETAVGRAVNLTITFEGAAPSSPPQIQIPAALRGQYSGRQNRFLSTSSGTRRQWSFTYRLIPNEAGEHQIPSQTFQINGEKLSTDPLTLRVSEQRRSSEEGSSERHAFIRLTPSETAAYAGETFPIQIELYVAVGVNVPQLQRPQIEADGFTFGPIPHEPERSKVVIDGRRYHQLIFELRASAVKAGQLTLGPASTQMLLEVPRSSHRSLFSVRDRRKVRVESKTHTIEISSLPQEEVPPSFNGAIGRFDISVSADPKEVTVGDPITYQVEIQGQGTLQALSLPEQSWDDFKSYPPSAVKQQTDELGIKGAKRFEQVVMPQNAELDAIPPFKFSFFDPEAGRYKTLEHPAIPISVGALESGPSQARMLADGASRSSTGGDQTELAHIKARPGKPKAIAPPLAARPWFIALQAIPMMAWLSGLAIRKRNEYLLRNPRRFRERRVRRQVQAGLTELERLAANDDSPNFAVKLFRLLQEQLGERLELPASSITEQVLEDRLRPNGASPQLIETLHELFEVCNQERYAPHRHRPELNALLPKINDTFRELRSYEKPNDPRASAKSTAVNVNRSS